MNNDDWKNIFPEVPQSFHATVQNTLNEQICDKLERNKVMKKRFPIAIVAVVAALCVTVATAYVTQWNGKLADRFKVNEKQQEQLASDGAVASVNKSITKNGLTITAVQTLGDKNGVYLLFDVKAPEGTKLSDTNSFEHNGIKIKGSGVMHNYSGGFMSNTDKTISPSGASNERYYELWLNNDEQKNWNGKTITLGFTNLQASKGKLDMYTVVKGNWELSWKLSYSNQTKTFKVNKAYNINEHKVLVKSIELSPLSMKFTLGGDGLKQLIDDSDFNQCGCLCKPSLKMKNGTTFKLNGGPGSETGTDNTYTYTIRFSKVLNVDQVTGFVLTFPWEKTNNTLTVSLH